MLKFEEFSCFRSNGRVTHRRQTIKDGDRAPKRMGNAPKQVPRSTISVFQMSKLPTFARKSPIFGQAPWFVRFSGYFLAGLPMLRILHTADWHLGHGRGLHLWFWCRRREAVQRPVGGTPLALPTPLCWIWRTGSGVSRCPAA